MKYLARFLKLKMLKARLTFEISVDLQMSKIKPIHARWFIHVQEDGALKRDMLASGFHKA